MMRDLKSNIDVAQSLAPAARTASANGSAVDLEGYDSAVGEFSAGAWTDGTHTPKLQDSDDNVTYTDVDAAYLQGSFTAVSGAGQQNAAQRVGYIGGKRYVRGVVTVAGATTGALSGFNVVRGNPRRGPLA